MADTTPSFDSQWDDALSALGLETSTLPDVGAPLISPGPEVSSGLPWANRAADIGSRLAYGMLANVGNALLAPGRALQSTQPVTTGELIAPAANLGMLTTLGAGAAPAEANALYAGLPWQHVPEMAEKAGLASDLNLLHSREWPGDYQVTSSMGNPLVQLTKNADGTYKLEASNGLTTSAPHLDAALAKAKDVYGFPGWAEGWEEPSDVTVTVPSPAASLPDLSDEAIAAALAKNHGASIFNLAGVSEYPSSPLKPIQDAEHPVQFGYLGRFPSSVPYLPPEEALAQGYVTPALHGTRLGEHRWQTPGSVNLPLTEADAQGADALRLPPDELGVHFGTPEQAHYFTSNVLGAGYLPRTYPTVLQTGNSLELPDTGTWILPRINDALDKLNTGKGWGVGHGGTQVANPEAHIGEFPPSERADIDSIEAMRDYLARKGYDSINYINNVEGPGQRSYIMFKPSPQEPDFVAGVRSRFAKFDPSKLARPELAAGLAGAASVPVLFDSQGKPYFVTK